ncbi:MAG: NAD(+)/NADH kinase [Methanotrichaceae archaeon]
MKIVRDLVERFGSRAEIFVEPETANKLGLKGTSIEEMNVDFVVSVGGDGTILKTIKQMEDPRPILGINMGTLGFLVDVEPEDAVKTLERTLFGFQVVERSRLETCLNNKLLPPATNEVALLSASPAKMLEFEIRVDDSFLEDLRADGLLFATSTGSTAYAMSAGGPIVDPRVDAVVLVPMAPFKLSARPWVLPGNSVIEVDLKLSDKEALVVIDGQNVTTISQKDHITISKAENPARFIKIYKDGFYEKVKSKLA